MALAAASALLAAPVALAAPTTITFTDGQIDLGAGSGQIVNPAQPVRAAADLTEFGEVAIAAADFDFPPVTTQLAPGQQATFDLIPEGPLTGQYDRASGQLAFDAADYTLRADVAGGTCEFRDVRIWLTTEAAEPFAGDRFDAYSVPPAGGALVGAWNDLDAAEGGAQCFALNQFTGGEGGIRLANAASAPEGGELTAKAKRKQLVYGQRATIRGRLSGVPSGSGGHTVELIERPYPYDQASERVRRETTSDDGSYAFKVDPDFNTKYVVRDASGSGAQSKPVQLWVYEKFRQRVRISGRTRVRSRVSLTYGPDLNTDFTKRRMFWYFNKKGTRSMTLKARTRIRQKPGKYWSSASFRIPNSRRGYRFFVLTCFDEPRGDDGTGKPGRYKCPRKKRGTFGDFRG